jgi:hypothetical protein
VPNGVAGRVHVSSATLAAVGAPDTAPGCLTFHESGGVRPSSFRGVILRGEGHVVRHGAQRSTVEVRADRVSWWSGFRSGTARAAA